MYFSCKGWSCLPLPAPVALGLSLEKEMQHKPFPGPSGQTSMEWEGGNQPCKRVCLLQKGPGLGSKSRNLPSVGCFHTTPAVLPLLEPFSELSSVFQSIFHSQFPALGHDFLTLWLQLHFHVDKGYRKPLFRQDLLGPFIICLTWTGSMMQYCSLDWKLVWRTSSFRNAVDKGSKAMHLVCRRWAGS